ncbi:hypothetical protein HMPREF0380_01428 [Eubacterium infirmum F0142]|nr:hypothetical protein HMPREF0380_01428 [Eubacterium infirmum F0142]
MISPESLKDKVKNIAKSKRLSSQEVLQMFFFERFLERLSHSKYKFNFVIKGGLLNLINDWHESNTCGIFYGSK